MALRVTGEPITTTLTIQFTDNQSVTTKYNADSTPTAKVYLGSTLVSTITGSDITNSTTGLYTVTWTPSAAGQYKVVWSFTVSGIEYTQDEDIFVLAAASTSVTPAGDADIGNTNVCRVTGTFIDAGGDYKKGVHVRFSPITVQAEHTSYGYIAGDISTESNSDGAIAFNAVRGVFGLLTITGIGIVRRVTIPNQDTIDIFELAGQGNDPLEIQTPVFVTLPRRSP